ncbi:co-chaperone HscB [Erwinia sp. OLTSP20]|uniref:co-chaperone HscB n=1 Tax=unclassified Erwinia TaxID=2622719 RepID=UPI000C19923D|nr:MULTISPECIES: co-chaperone HscB [unclassified Erwinia]PIJ52358.1 co-chaperone HscB [Erwinia sp. OAMSP11]PIJ73567.1 co-chaperone HscB [Erwinia sp. OLSSP12]PIJ85384.1 co-chaperone HscB [Erwinia sp. OLCASP19]PIJ87626.1 co-chaperone HscB [Erwinia sp. OLMTSP26]PIJ89132.1 co-chaperone HscB [Erwinia sp. OLMDSP33]
MDYFALFGLPPSFDIDNGQLTSRFQELQRQFHPDRVASRPENERLQAVQQAATINQAYQALKKPLPRAEYLLSLHGIDISNEQHTLKDSDFLLEQLTMREALETIGQQQDSAALYDFMQRLDGLTAPRHNQLRDQLLQHNWAQAADSVRKLRFLAKLRSEAEALEERLLDL